MLTISQIRKERHGEWTRLVVDIDFGDVKTDYAEKTLWFAVRNENADMLTDETYDAFVLVPLYLAMYYHTDLHICGHMSKLLYQNIKWYVRRILCDFSPDLAMVDVKADDFASIPGKGELIGTGISCGVDSLCTIMDHFVKEKDPDYRINSLFLFDAGFYGLYEDPKARERYEGHLQRNKKAADEMGLPVIEIMTNAHSFFIKEIGFTKVAFFTNYSCVLSLQKVMSKYYPSSAYSYSEEKIYGIPELNPDMAEYCEAYLVPLIETEHTRLIVDGCQYSRTQKTENIADWDIAQRYLNVCIANPADGGNCCMCSKCMRTMVPLEALGKLEKFSSVFDLSIYRKYEKEGKRKMVMGYGKDAFHTDNVDFARAHHLSMPSKLDAVIHEEILGGVLMFAREGLKASLSKENWEAIKGKLKNSIGEENFTRLKQILRK